MHGWAAFEVTPGLARPEIDDDEAGAAFCGAVGYVRHSLVKVEADIIEVGIPVGNCWREDDGLEDSVVLEVDTNEFGAAVGGVDECIVGCKGAAGIEEPEAVSGVDYCGLAADEVVLVVCASRWEGGVVYGAAWWVVDLC